MCIRDRYNDKCGFLLGFSAALSGMPCSMEYSFHVNELIFFGKKNWSWLNKSVEGWNTKRKLRDSFNAQEACKLLVGHYAMIEIVMVLYKKCRFNYPRIPTVWYRCSYVNLLFYFTITGHKKLKITYNNKLLHYRDFFYNRTDYQVSSSTTEQIYKRTILRIRWNCPIFL